MKYRMTATRCKMQQLIKVIQRPSRASMKSFSSRPEAYCFCVCRYQMCCIGHEEQPNKLIFTAGIIQRCLYKLFYGTLHSSWNLQPSSSLMEKRKIQRKNVRISVEWKFEFSLALRLWFLWRQWSKMSSKLTQKDGMNKKLKANIYFMVSIPISRQLRRHECGYSANYLALRATGGQSKSSTQLLEPKHHTMTINQQSACTK